MTFKNISEIAAAFGTTPDHIEKALYKSTACGAWIRWDNRSATIGSIVEGSDAEFSYTFCFPFDEQKLWDFLELLEKLTGAAWKIANDEEATEETEAELSALIDEFAMF